MLFSNILSMCFLSSPHRPWTLSRVLVFCSKQSQKAVTQVSSYCRLTLHSVIILDHIIFLSWLPKRENNLFFWRSTSDNFFYVLSKMYVTFGVFSGQHIFYQFRQQTFFLPTFSTNFSDLISIFYSPPPPPRYQMVRPL